MHVLVYDGSFEGLLTCIFDVYELKWNPVTIKKFEEANTSLFGTNRLIETSSEKAARVLKRLKQQISPNNFKEFFKGYLSELPGMEDSMLRYVQYVIGSKLSVENNMGHADVLLLHQTAHKVDREKHRMKAFIRFQLTGDGLYYALVQPDFNVLPLISKHFEDRYADQRWLIYDTRRKYGIYYDLPTVNEVDLTFSSDMQNKESLAMVQDAKEEIYQKLWQQYFNSVNIAARKNMKLHIQHMPKRYWRYLVEKKNF